MEAAVLQYPGVCWTNTPFFHETSIRIWVMLDAQGKLGTGWQSLYVPCLALLKAPHVYLPVRLKRH